jgi:hypothetical protein
MNTHENAFKNRSVELSAMASLSQEQQRLQRQRSLAIAWALGALVVIFFIATIVRIGSNTIN